MKQIPLSRGMVTLVDDEAFESLSRWKWYALKLVRSWYAGRNRRPEDGPGPCTILMHRVLLCPPEGMEVGHINGDGLDNRRENLRVATRKMNCRNRIHQKPNRKYPLPMGVYPRGRRFLARIVQDGRSRCLGRFATPGEASAVYQAARRESVEAGARTHLLLHAAG